MINVKGIRKLFSNEYVFSLITKCFMVVIGLAESALLARYLGADLRGDLSYIYSVASTAYFVITFGIYTAYPFRRRDPSLDLQELLNEFMTITSVLFIIYAAIFFSACAVFASFNQTMAVILFMLPIMGYDNVSSYVALIENPNKMNAVTVIVNIIQLLYLVVLIIFFEGNLLAGAGYYLIGCIIKSVYFTWKLHFRFEIRLFSFKKLFEYMKFGFFPMLAMLLTTLNYRLDVIMLKQFDFITSAQIGIYSIGIGLSEKAFLIPDAIKDVLLSKLAKGKKEDEVARAMRICFLAGFVTAIAITVLGGLVIKLLYGSEYAGAEIITYISVWGTITMVFFKMISQYNVVEHKQHLNVIFLSAAIIINCVLNLLLIPALGTNGAAIATSIGYCVSACIFLIYFKRVSGLPFKKMVFVQKEDTDLIKNMLVGNR